MSRESVDPVLNRGFRRGILSYKLIETKACLKKTTSMYKGVVFE